VIVVATTEAQLARVRSRLSELGVVAGGVVAPSDARRLVLVPVDDDWAADRLATTLRTEGVVAVIRPDDGPQLEEWRRTTRPIAFDERLSVSFAWSEHERRHLPGLVELGLGGFGSGDHPSTRMVIEELLLRIRGGERVLDVGCGSGVLGLCALQLGADRVVSMDLKPTAAEATRRNAVLNAMSDRLEATVAPLSEIDEPFDVVVANVGRAAIVELAPQLVRLVSPGGWLGVSGISASQGSLVAAFLRPLVEVERRTSGEWSTLVLAPP
jgi:ribosomal protein L11 methyltransferase